MSKLGKIFKNVRVIILIACLFFAFITIGQQSGQGIVIKSVEENSAAFNGSVSNPSPEIQPTQYEKIISINSKQINTLEDYNTFVSTIPLNSSIRLLTDKKEYVFLKTNENIGIGIGKRASSNIRKGLELQGGTRVLLKPEKAATDQDIQDVISVMQKRLNVYGLTDLTIKPASDLFGEKYIVVEIAGVTKEEVKDFISKQGVFEAKIGNNTVFMGGEKDVTFVCRNDGTCSGIRNCGAVTDGFMCKFEFTITTSPEAAQRQADATKNLEVISGEGGQKYLSEQIEFYLDGKLVDSLNIASDLKGQAATNIAITGPGVGKTQQEALTNANENMKKLQTVLITGSLPTKLEIIKLDSISPSLGEAFLNNTLLTGFIALLAVCLVIFLRYRKLKIVIPIFIAMASEIYITLAVAALIRWNLDLASIAGIIVSVGTGVDDQIVITDEVLNKESTDNMKQNIKKAFFIIMAAYATTVAAMLPLLRAGAGLLTGFAFVTIIGVSIGVFITRPAFASMIRIWLEE